MKAGQPLSPARTRLPIILLAAVIQGGGLFGLYHASKHGHWPATYSSWLVALYALVILIPTTVQLLAEHSRKPAHWGCVAMIAIAVFYFGWHQGVAYRGTSYSSNGEIFFPFGLIVAVFWLMLLPFVQSRLVSGQWKINYPLLFSCAWRNKLMLAEAVLFTGLFWLLLFLWQSLFSMLGIYYFRQLFTEPTFVYPATSITFGVALHLIGSIDRWTTIVLDQILNVLKWLATVAGVILALFTTALIFKLPGMIATGQKAIGAVWLLWLIAVVVLFLNAAYRDGTNATPYPAWLARPLRWIVPLTTIIALTALSALGIRTQQYGLTVERVWAFIVAGSALIYAFGYSLSALDRSRWLPSMARVNVVAAIALIVAIGAALTPLLSPYRLAADSQFRMAQEFKDEDGSYGVGENSPFHYLRFDAGWYGQKKLEELAELKNHPRGEQIRTFAKAALAQKQRWEHSPQTKSKLAAVISELKIYPAGRTLDAGLRDTLIADLTAENLGYPFSYLGARDAAGIFIDLNADNIDEFVLQADSSGLVYQQQSGQWRRVAQSRLQGPTSGAVLTNALDKGDLSTRPILWHELSIGEQVYTIGKPDDPIR